MKPNILRFEAPGLAPWHRSPTPGPPNVLHGLLIEGRTSLALLEVGLGTLDLIAPWRRLGLSAPRWESRSAALPVRHQLTLAGYSADDVTDIFVSHLYACHTGGLHDFPRARVHGLPDALGIDRNRIARLLPDPTRWVSPTSPPEPYRGLTSYVVNFEDQALRLIALPGPFPGHAGWLVPHETGWLWHLGALVESPEELSERSDSKRQVTHLFTDHRPFSRLESQQRARRILSDPAAEVSALASFVSPTLLGVSLPLLGAAESSDG